MQGNLVFSSIEGIDAAQAFEKRERFSETTGTIAIAISPRHLTALMADPRIDFIIPYHESGMPKALRESMSVTGWVDFTDTQNESVSDEAKLEAYGGKKLFRNDVVAMSWWNPEQTGDQNAQNYLALCEKAGMTPKFHQYKDVPGYWKTLIDRKMFNNDGIYIEQQAVTPEYDMEAVQSILDNYVPEPQEAHAETVNELADIFPAEIPFDRLMTGTQVRIAKDARSLSIAKPSKNEARRISAINKLIINGVKGEIALAADEKATIKGLPEKQLKGFRYLAEIDKAAIPYPKQFAA
jgi:hypothetical protein